MKRFSFWQLLGARGSTLRKTSVCFTGSNGKCLHSVHFGFFVSKETAAILEAAPDFPREHRLQEALNCAITLVRCPHQR
jgi:hypothetical protein